MKCSLWRTTSAFGHRLTADFSRWYLFHQLVFFCSISSFERPSQRSNYVVWPAPSSTFLKMARGPKILATPALRQTRSTQKETSKTRSSSFISLYTCQHKLLLFFLIQNRESRVCSLRERWEVPSLASLVHNDMQMRPIWTCAVDLDGMWCESGGQWKSRSILKTKPNKGQSWRSIDNRWTKNWLDTQQKMRFLLVKIDTTRSGTTLRREGGVFFSLPVFSGPDEADRGRRRPTVRWWRWWRPRRCAGRSGGPADAAPPLRRR